MDPVQNACTGCWKLPVQSPVRPVAPQGSFRGRSPGKASPAALQITPERNAVRRPPLVQKRGSRKSERGSGCLHSCCKSRGEAERWERSPRPAAPEVLLGQRKRAFGNLSRSGEVRGSNPRLLEGREPRLSDVNVVCPVPTAGTSRRVLLLHSLG